MANQYYYLNAANQQCGPVPASQLKANGVRPETLVWCNGMAGWAAASSVAELQAVFAAPPQPPVPPQAAPQPAPQPPVAEKPTNWLVWSILSTILCCVPFGITSIIFAAKANSAYAAGDTQTGDECNKKAKLWFILAAAIGFAIQLVYFIFVLACM